MRRRRGWLTPLLLVVGLSAACGDEDPGERANESVTTRAPSTTSSVSVATDEDPAPTTTGDAASTELPSGGSPLDRDTVFVIDGPRLWRVDPETGERSIVIELDAAEQIRSAERSPDGIEVIVVSERGEPPTSTLWIAGIDTSAPLRLIHLEGETRITSARLSPDGDQILTVRESRVDYGANLFVTGRESGDDLRLTDLSDDEPIHNPSIDDEQFSPDGQTILFGVYDWPSDTIDLFAVSVDGHDRRSLTSPDDMRSTGRPTWSADGSRVAYVSTIDGSDASSTDVYTVPIAGGETNRLTTTSDDESVWIEALHPDGARLLISVRDVIFAPGIADGRLLLLDFDGTVLASVFSVEDGESLGRANFVLDGSTVLFDTTGDRTNALFTVDLEGGNRTAVTDPEGWIVFHEVSPSGNRVLYRADGDDATTSLLDLRSGTTIDIAGETVFFAG